MSAGAPSGIVSFLFTDVEGSTGLWEHDPAAMSSSLALHDDILRSEIDAHGGYVFSTAGDSYGAAFPTTTGALDAAVSAQLRLTRAEWPGPRITVRMGVHAGEAEERDGDYFGPALNKGARIMAAAHGGQILVSATAEEMSKAWRPPSTALVSIGIHRLESLDHPEHLFLVNHPELPAIEDPLRFDADRGVHLPDYLTSFVGRRAELAAVVSLVRDHRLVVLTGVGGTGKTRLAVESTKACADDFPDGCWMIELAPIAKAGVVASTIGEVWGLRPGPGATIEEVITGHLHDRQILVVVDNCEHLLDAAADAVQIMLAAGAGVKVLATSRESLGIPGEAIMRVPSLGLPTGDSIVDSEAVRLFLDRVHDQRPDFEASDEDLSAIQRIAVRTDGIPLALELAAARLRSLSAAELADRLDESFRVLSGSAKTALPRQRTLHATIEWSYTLLEPQERAVFRRMALFTGGFDLPAAEAVCSCAEVPSAEVLDRLDSLVDKSLLTPVHDPELGTRYRLLEPVRQYAQEQLMASGDADTVRAAHADHYASRVAQASPFIRGPDQMTWQRRIDADYDNIRAAFAELLEGGRIDAYLDMAFDLFGYWQHVGFHFEGIPTIEAGIAAAPDGTDAVRLVKAYFTMAALGFETTLPRSVADSATGLELAKATGDLNLIGRMELAHGAAIRHSTSRPDFAEHVLRGRELIEANRRPYWWEPEWEDAFHDFLFSGYLPPGDDRRREHSTRAITTFEQLGDQAQLVATLCESAMGMFEGIDEWIVANLQRAVELVERIDVPYWHGHAYYFLGEIDLLSGRPEAAIGRLRESLTHLEDCGDLSCWAGAMRAMALAQNAVGHHDDAQRTAAAVLRRTEGLPMPERAVPRALALTARILLDDAKVNRAAVIVGSALAAGAEAFLLPELPSFEKMADEVRSHGGAEAETLMAESRQFELPDLLIRAAEWLDE